MEKKEKIAKAAGKMSVATFISRILGFARDMVIAFYFGATGLSDTFFIAFRIPNLLRELFAEGSMTSAFIPVLTEYQKTKGFSESKRLVRVTFTFILIAVGLITIAGIIFAPAVVSVIAPGFVKFPEKFHLAVLLTRIMFPFLLFVSLAALVMGALNTKGVFFIPSLAPAMLNIAIITTVFLLVSRLAQPVVSVALGVLFGGFIQFAFQLPAFFGKGYSLRPDFNLRHPGLIKTGKLVLPATMGLAVSQINILLNSIFASFLAGGSITYLFYSMRLIQFPIGVFGVAMGMAALPALSEHAVKGDFDRLREDFSFSLRLLFFISVPAMAGLIALREPIVNLLFQRGAFDYNATRATAEALLFYSIGIWTIVGVRVVTATFYSLQDTKTPVKIAAVGVGSNIVLSLILMGPLKHSGLALAYSLASGLNFSLLFYFLKRRLKDIDAAGIKKSLIKISIASLVMGIAGRAMLHGELWHEGGNTIEKFMYLAGTIMFCIVIYAGLGFLLKNEELKYLFELLKKKFQK